MTLTRVAVVGGGLSGLSAAYALAQSLPKSLRESSRITLYEKGPRLGGWAGSVRHDLRENRGKLVFEKGPRSIRPAGVEGWMFIKQALDLGLEDQLAVVGKDAPSARNRMVYVDGKLVRMPGSDLASLGDVLRTLSGSPTLREALWGLIKGLFKNNHEKRHAMRQSSDTSVDGLVRSLFGPHAATFASAFVHGVYSGDSRQLSARWTMPTLWHLGRQKGRRLVSDIVRKSTYDAEYRQFRDEAEHEKEAMKGLKMHISEMYPSAYARLENASVWSFSGGLQTYVDAIESHIRALGVNVVYGEASVGLEGSRVTLTTPSEGETAPDYVLLTDLGTLPGAPAFPATTVAVVSLAYDPLKGHEVPQVPPGFGYLIPAGLPRSANPHDALGTIFDTYVMPGVDDSARAGLLKVSVLLGGSHWNGQNVSDLSAEELVSRATDTLSLHLPQTDPGWRSPAYSSAALLRECIPQVPVGGIPAMTELSGRIRAFNEESTQVLSVTGRGVNPIGVNWAVRGGEELGRAMAQRMSGYSKKVVTGLARWEVA